MKLLQPHEWHYLQHTAVNKTEAVCWRHGYMINPDKETLFVTGPPDHEFLINPANEKLLRFGNGQLDADKEYQWGPGIEENGEDKQNSVTEFIKDLL